MNAHGHTFTTDAKPCHIEAMRYRSETDLRAARRARLLQRRIKAALANDPLNRSSLAGLARKLHWYRASGFPGDLHWFLGEYAEFIRSELVTAQRRWRMAV